MAFIRNGEFKEQKEKDNFFKLENDKDIKLVRFLHKDLAEVPVVTYHLMDIDGYTRKISCLRSSYDDPISKCPLCAKNDKFQQRKYLQLLVYNTDENGTPIGGTEVQIWDRGKKFIDKIEGLQRRLKQKGKNLCDALFDIERIGKKGDTSTTYEVYLRDDLDESKYPYELPEELHNPIGKSIFDCNYQELTNLANGKPMDYEGVEKREESVQEQHRVEPIEDNPAPRTEAQPTYSRRRL